jgi:hypothetical protein
VSNWYNLRLESTEGFEEDEEELLPPIVADRVA